LHHFAFLVWLLAQIFSSSITRFYPPKTHFLAAILPFLALFLMVREAFIYRIAVYFYAFLFAFRTISYCILHHFALCLASKRTAFSGILHCILQQIAPKMVQMTVSLNKNTSCLHLFPIPFSSKPTFARIDFLRQGGRLVNEKATQDVKFLT